MWYPFSIFGCKMCKCRTTVDFKSVADTPARIRTNKTTTVHDIQSEMYGHVSNKHVLPKSYTPVNQHSNGKWTP